MRKLFTLTITLIFCSITFAQSSLQLTNGRFAPQAVASLNLPGFYKQQAPVAGKRFVVLQWAGPLTAAQRTNLATKSISLQAYIPPYSYTATLNEELGKTDLQTAGITGIGYLPPAFKISKALLQPEKTTWLQGNNGLMDVLVKVAGISIAEATALLKSQHINVVSSGLEQYDIIKVRIAAPQIASVAANPFAEWLEPAHPKDQTLNYRSNTLAASNVAHASTAAGGYNLTGAGVVAGVGDDSDPSSHIDLADRIINRTGFLYDYHGTHVTGTFGGAGILNYALRGYAPSVKIVSQILGGIWLNAATYIADFGMTLTNNSYGNIEYDPTYEGVYDLYSQILDQQAIDFPDLLNVFAVGNDGGLSVPPYPQFYGTILSGYQTAKNVLCVGQMDNLLTARNPSSSGPTRDGRLKPEIMALGEGVQSTGPSNSYFQAWGTSQAAPAVTGGAALLSEQYHKQFGAANPKAGLLKALIMNGGLDVGNTGPDFRHGYGALNLPRSLDMLKNNHFYTNSIATGGLQTQTITVPANTAILKVMLYWNDPAAAIYAAKSLVNDLDIEVLNPSGNIIQPQRLDTVSNNVANIATTGPGHTNNNEQVIINNPVAGTYTIRVKGYAVNVNPTQSYFVTYDYLPIGLQLYSPWEGEGYFPGEGLLMHWEDNGTGNNQRTLEYSTDNGTTWNLIANNIAANALAYDWGIPNVTATTTAKVRITENSTGYSSTSGRFTIAGPVYHSFADASQQCEGYCKIIWPAVSGATDYQVLMKRGPEMEIIATTTNLSYTVSGLNKDSVYWFSVLPRINGVAGKRSNGQAYQPNGGSCGGNISDGDLKLDAILSPSTGRRFSASGLSANEPVSIQIKNLDDAAVNDYDVKYSINGGAFTSQHINTSVAAGATVIVNFPAVNFSAEGIYNIIAIVKNTALDGAVKNDTLTKTVKQLANAPLVLTTPFLEDFEVADSAKYENATMGLTGLDRWDFAPLTGNGDSYGRLRTFLNRGIANGSRGITIDVNKFVDNTNLGTSQLKGTFNLANYNAATDEVRFDFLYKQHGSFQQDATAGKNIVQVKGSESATAQTAYDLTANQPVNAGQFRRSESIELSDIVAGAGQNFSATTQIIFNQTSSLGTSDATHFAGFTFDDVRLYTVANDMQAIAIDTPATNNCAQGVVPIRLRVKNSMSYALNSIPVKFQVDGGAVITETIASIAPNTVTAYTFTAPANISATGSHIIKAWTDLVADNFRGNDTISKTIVNQPVISSFPYLQDFESSSGNFYTGGKNVSWAYGLPNGFKIRTAASGTKAWKTGLSGNYNDEEASYLYTPCFNTSSLTVPTISFAMAYDIEYCRPISCDGAWVEYSTNGETWQKLGSTGSGTNWYNNSTGQFWDSVKLHWHVATTALPIASNLRLRFAFASDLFSGREGVAIDDIHVYDNAAPIFDGNSNSNLITQNVSGTGTVPFADGGKLIATILPNGNTLGSTGVKAYINNGPVRNDAQQYYANRNITVQPQALNATTPVTVRMYVTDAEVDSLRKATGCPTCRQLKDYTYLGITKYDDADKAKENGTMADNQNGVYSYFGSTIVRKVPYDKGYYAEVAVNSFSELWLNEGTVGNIILPIQWSSFIAEKRTGDRVLLQWAMQNESNAAQYEVEVLRPGSNGYQRLAVVLAINQQPVSHYTFTDSSTGKQGVYQYRIKRVDRNGQISYSDVRQVLFGNKNLNVMIYPNPITTTVQVMLQGVANTPVQLYLYDATGKLLQQQHTTATGATQKLQLSVAGLPVGVYQLKVQSGNDVTVEKVVKEN